MVHYSGPFLKDKLVKGREKKTPVTIKKQNKVMNAHGTTFCVIHHEIWY